MKDAAPSEHSDSLKVRDGVILPEHQSWLHRFLRESHEVSLDDLFQRNTITYESYRSTARPESDPIDIFRQEVRRPLNFSRKAEIHRAQERLTKQLEKDIQAVLEEHRKLQYQSRVWKLDDSDPENSWPGLEHHSETKALEFLHSSKNYAEWKVNFIRYLRYTWENQQADALQAFIDAHRDLSSFEETAPAELLGAHTMGVLDTLNIPFIATDKNAVLHPGKFLELRLTGSEKVSVSPKFYLAMPDNPFVHAGNRSYVNLYQIVAIQRAGSTSPEFHLLADFYYAQLSLPELASLSQQFLPEKQLPSNTTEQMILETTGEVPASFTHTAPFLLFLSMARSLGREVSLASDPSLRFVQEQAVNQEFVRNQKANVQRGAAVFSQILLTEYALSHYFPHRQTYVGEVLFRTFEVVLIAVLTGQELTPEKTQHILDEYRKKLVLEVEGLRDREVNWQSYSVKGRRAQPTTRVLKYFDQPDIHVQQQNNSLQNSRLRESGNLFLAALEPFIRGAATGIPSCASCLLGATARLGGIQPVPGAMGAVNAGGAGVGSSRGGTQSGLSSWFGTGGSPFSERSSAGNGGGSSGLGGQFQSSDFMPNAVDSFLRQGFSSAADATRGFQGAFIQPGELLTYLLIGDRALR